MMRENAVQRDIFAYLGSQPWCRLFRNNVGVFRTLDGERVVRVGLCEGSSDLVGLLAPHGRFLAIEAKRPGEKTKKHQEDFLAMVRMMGGLAFSARSLDEAKQRLAEEGYPNA